MHLRSPFDSGWCLLDLLILLPSNDDECLADGEKIEKTRDGIETQSGYFKEVLPIKGSKCFKIAHFFRLGNIMDTRQEITDEAGSKRNNRSNGSHRN